MSPTTKIKHEILDLVKSDNGCSVQFDYTQNEDNTITVRAFTVNPKRGNEMFLLKSVIATDEEHALTQILNYLKLKHELSSFTITWTKSGHGKTEKSYFYCHDALEAIKKFFEDKNVVDYIIYDLKLNPIA